MRKLPLLIFLLIFTLASCAVKPAEPQLNFSQRIIIDHQGERLTADIVSDRRDVLTISIVSPPSLKGLTYSYKDYKIKLSYKNMRVNAEDNYLPNTAFARIIYNVLKRMNSGKYELKSADNSFAEYSGSCESGKFSLKTHTRTGKISEIKVNSQKLSVKFR